MILKIIKRNKEERILDYFISENGLNENISVNDTIYFICESCGKEDSCRKNSFNNECSSCKRKQTNLEKYNNPNYNNREKVKETFLKKYGWKKEKKIKDEKKTQEKRKETFLKKYGVENPNQIKEAKNKSKNTRLKKYGSFNNFEKIKTTNLIKYGTEYAFQNEEIKEKIKQTMIEKYGVEHALKNKDLLDELKRNNLENIGVEFYFQLEECRQLSKKAMFYNLKIFKQGNVIPLFSYEEYVNTHISNKYPFQCKTCNTVFEDHLDNGRIPRCPTCFPLNRSKGEIELANLLKEYIPTIENDRTLISPYEIDILIPSLKIAIEYNGEYWHQDEEKEKTKRDLIESTGYDYIVIWENDWLNNKEEIKKALLNKIGL